MKSPLRTRFLAAVAATVLSTVTLQAGHAATSTPTPTNLSIAQQPLALAVGVEPNLILAIDDSGSMDFEFLLASNDGAAWWRTTDDPANLGRGNGNTSDPCYTASYAFTGCTANVNGDALATGVLNFNNGGNSSSLWKKFAYLFPNGANSNNNSDQRRLSDSTNDHYAVPPIPAYAWARSSDFNPAYFNPATAYKAWPAGGGFTFSDASTTATRWDAVYSTSNTTIDLTRDFAGNSSTDTTNPCNDNSLPGMSSNYYFRVFHGMTLPQGTCFFASNASSNVGSKDQHWQVASSDCVIDATCSVSFGNTTDSYTLRDNSSVAIRYFPATFYLKTGTALPTGYGYTGTPLTGYAPDGTLINGYQIKPGNFSSTALYNAAIQNFANWFQYYRKRHQALRGGLGSAFNNINNTRVGGFTMNQQGSSPTSPDVTMLDINNPTNRTSLYQAFYQTWTGSGGTPTRPVLANLVRNYRRTDANAPIQSACQQNFGMLFTDGFANPPASGDGFDTVGNVDSSMGAPYADGVSNTMADGIAAAYVNNLRPDLTAGEVTVPAACSAGGAAQGVDCNTNLHMNFFGITLGTKGFAFNPAAPVNPYTANPAVVWPTATQLSQVRNPAAVDDLWHATVNGRGALLNANSPADVADKLSSVLQSIAARVGSAAAVALQSQTFSVNSRAFLTKFDTNTWDGDVFSAVVNSDGTFSSTGTWSAAAQMPSPTSRQIFTTTSAGVSTPFEWASFSSDTVRQGQLEQTDTSATVSATVASARVSYLRGDHTQEQQNGGTFRNRPTALGDIINSSPAVVGVTNFRYPDSLETASYSSFVASQANRAPALYVGANDGMMHAFSVSTGQEYFAFVPGGVFANLYRLTEPTYTHRYFVDQSPLATDAFWGTSWHTVLTSGLNAGGQSVFALDVTKPDQYTESGNATPFLWEFTDAQDADLGDTFSQAVVVRLHNGKWAAVFGNGYNNTVADGNASTTGDAVLYIVDVSNGSLIKKLDTGAGMAQDPTNQSRPNGLATPLLVDANGDSISDYAYAGDLFGNLWKFDLTDTDPSNWKVSYGQPLFVATNASSPAKHQPITTQPQAARGPGGAGLIILFGTGKYLETGDTTLANLTTESFYGIIDKNTGVAQVDVLTGRSQLTKQQVIYETTETITRPDGSTFSAPVAVTSNNPLGTGRGWYLDLLSANGTFSGEMQVSQAFIDSGNVIFSTLTPSGDACSGGGTSRVFILNLLTGSRLDTPVFDLNGDGKFNSSDYITVPNVGQVAISAMGLPGGIASAPTQLATNNTNSSNTGGGGSNCDYLLFAMSNGTTESLCKNPGPHAVGRQSWRQAH